MRWMNLEPVIQNEVNQNEKDKYHILTHIYMESRKMVLRNLFIGEQWRKRHREQTYGQRIDLWTENRLMDMGRGEEMVRCMQRVTWKLTLPYVKLIVNEILLYG